MRAQRQISPIKSYSQQSDLSNNGKKQKELLDSRPISVSQNELKNIIQSKTVLQRETVIQARSAISKENFTQFTQDIYPIHYENITGQFNSIFVPNNSILYVGLPVCFPSKEKWPNEAEAFAPGLEIREIDKDEKKTFKETVEKTWNKKNAFEINPEYFSEHSDLLKPIDIEVRVFEVKENSPEIFFQISANDIIDKSWVSKRMGAAPETQYASLSKNGYESTKKSNDGDNEYKNVYGHEAGHMFGLDDEYQIGNDNYVVQKDIEAYENSTKTIKKYAKQDDYAFIHDGVSYRMQKIQKEYLDELKMTYTPPKRKIRGEEYTSVNVMEEDSTLLFLDGDGGGERINALPGTLTENYKLIELALGTNEAQKHGVMNNKEEGGSSIMNSGSKVMPHHYVTFWDALVKSINNKFADENKAPILHEDWKIKL